MKVNLIVIITFFLLVGCGSGGSQLRDRLGEIDRLAEREPEQAIAALDSIKGMGMSNADRRYYDLLTIKAKDKAYVTHTSDSLILTTIDYYESNHDDRLTPMALYYGGRVYSDLGDYPTALHYFQRAIELLGKDCVDLKLFGSVLTQSAWILDRMRLHDNAILYLERAIQIDEAIKDTVRLLKDMHFLANVNVRAKKYYIAEGNLRSVMSYEKYQKEHNFAKSRLLLSNVKLKTGNIDSALFLVRGMTSKVLPQTKHMALAYASEIYLAAGIKDTSYMYAHELIYNPEFSNRKTGYKILLSPELRSMIHPDSLDKYITDYRNILEDFFDENQKELVNMQLSKFNYELHERQRLKAESERNKVYMWLAVTGLIVAMLVILALYMRMRNQSTLAKLKGALSNVALLKQQLTIMQAGLRDDNVSVAITNTDDIQQLREQLRNELMRLYGDGQKRIDVSPLILESDAYKEIQNLIKKEKPVGDYSKLWDRLESVIKICSPNFETNLRLLTGGKLTKSEYQTAMLIKIGVTPSQMNTLLARSKGTISSRREAICVKVFDKKMGTKIIDGIIRLL